MNLSDDRLAQIAASSVGKKSNAADATSCANVVKSATITTSSNIVTESARVPRRSKRVSATATARAGSAAAPVPIASQQLSSDAAEQALSHNQLTAIEKQLRAPGTNTKSKSKTWTSQSGTATSSSGSSAGTAGKGWFNMVPTELTPEQQRDLNVLKMRNYVDPKKHYRAHDSKNMSKFTQLGTIITPAHEFYTDRVPKKQRAKSFAEEFVTGDDRLKRYAKRKFSELQEVGRRGRKGKGRGKKGHGGHRGKASGSWA